MDDEDVYEYKGGIHQRHRHFWFRFVNGKIVDSDQYRHDLEERALPPEPRTCETCGTGCSNRGAKVVGLNLNESKSCPEWTPRAPWSADVETVREFIEYISESFLHYSVVRQRKADALAALDRIAGKVE